MKFTAERRTYRRAGHRSGGAARWRAELLRVVTYSKSLGSAPVVGRRRRDDGGTRCFAGSARGETLALVGPSGSGKSALARCLAGFEKRIRARS